MNHLFIIAFIVLFPLSHRIEHKMHSKKLDDMLEVSTESVLANFFHKTFEEQASVVQHYYGEMWLCNFICFV